MFRLDCCDEFSLALIHAKTSVSLKQTGLFTSEDEQKVKNEVFETKNSVANRKLCLTISLNHRTLWVGRDVKDHLVPIPSTRPGCS